MLSAPDSQPHPPQVTKGDAPYKHIVVIVNPASGQDRPILGIFNKAFHDANINWDIKLTKEAGDAERFAREAIVGGADAVGVYGGDGTVMEVANGLVNTDIPLAIFPGGTANVMSVELGIPGDLVEALALVCSDTSYVRTVDVGRVRERYFLLRLGIGFEADVINNADRQIKDRLGKLAYILSAFKTNMQRTKAAWHLTLDGDPVEAEGVTCMVANSGNIGLPGLPLSRTIDVSDGLLDVLVIRDMDIGSLLQVAASAAGLPVQLQHWQVKTATIDADPAQAVICDGESLDPTPVTAEIVPQGLHVIVPKQAIPPNQRDQNQANGDRPS